MLVIVLAALAAPQLWYPLWFDQGALAACADILRQGGVMFRDCFDVRGPAAAVVYLIPRLLSSSPVAIHAFDLLCQAVTAVLIGLLARRMWNQRAGVAAGVLYWLLVVSVNYWAAAQAESFANLFFVLALYAAWRGMETGDSRSEMTGRRIALRTWWVLSGAYIGVLFWFKYPFALIGLLPVLFVVFAARPRKPAEAPTPGASASPSLFSVLQSLFIGALVVLTLGILYFALNGALSNLQSQISYDVVTFNNVSLAYRLEWLRTIFWEEAVAFVSFGNTPTAGFKDTLTQVSILGRGYPFVFLLMAAGLLAGLAQPERRKPTIYALGYFLLTVMICLWQGHFYRYHFLIVLPAMALLAASNLQSPFRQSSIINRQFIIQTFKSLLWLGAVVGLAASMLPWAYDALDNALAQGKSAETLYLESKLAPYSLVARALADQTQPQDRIAVFSDVPAVYPLAQRQSGTRFPYVRPLEEAGSADLRTEYARQYLDDLTRNQPRFFVLTQPDFPWAGADFISLWKSMPAIHQYVEANYHYVGESGPFVLFVRNKP